MKYLMLLCFLIMGCTKIEPKFKESTRVTIKKEGYCIGYVKTTLNTGWHFVFDKKEEPKYYLSMACKSRDLIFTQPVVESDLVEVPRKVTHEQWEELYAKGPKFKVKTTISDNKGCKGFTDYPYLSDDGDWMYPLSLVECPKGEVSAFPALIEEADIDLLADQTN